MRRLKLVVMKTLIILGMICLSVIIVHQSAYATTKTKPLPIKKVRIRSYQNRTLKVTWKKTKGADGYQIYRYEPKKKKFVKAGEVGVGKKAWISPKVKKKQTYKVRAFRKNGRKKVYGKFSYEVSAIFYKKQAKKVNAGKVIPSCTYKRLNYYDTMKIKVRIKTSTHAGNKRAKVYDKKLRWYSSDKKIARVNDKGVVTPTGKPGVCQIYARAHNGNCTGDITVKVVNYARPDQFRDVEHTQKDIAKLLTDYPEELKDIAEYFERIHAQKKGKEPIGSLHLNDERTAVVTKSELEFKEIQDVLYKVMDSFPGEMMITITADGVKFDLSDDVNFNALSYVFFDVDDLEENSRHFRVASRWIYRNYAYRI